MRRTLVFTLTLLLAGSLFGVRNWNTYTNTTHVFDAVEMDGKLWLATWGGLVEFDPETGAFLQTYTNIDGLSSQDVRSLAALPETGELFIGTSGAGVDRMIDGELKTPVDDIIGLVDNRILDIAARDSMLFVSTVLGVSAFTASADFPFPLLIETFGEGEGPDVDDMTEIGVTDNGYLVCMYEGGINYVHVDSLLAPSNWRTLEVDGYDLDDDLRSMSVNGHNIALSTGDALFRITGFPNNTQVEQFTTTNGLESTDVYPVFIDAQGDLWFSYGVWDADALQLDSPDSLAWVSRIDTQVSIDSWGYTDGLTISGMKGFFEYNGTVWANSWGEGCFKFWQNAWTQYMPQSISSNVITTMVMDDNYQLWTASGYLGSSPSATGTRGVSMYDEDTDEWTTWRAATSSLRSDNVNCLAVDALGRIWMGIWSPYSPEGWRNGISVYDPATDMWRDLYGELLSATITSIIPDPRTAAQSEPNMWISCFSQGGGGVIQMDMDFNTIEQFEVPWRGEGYQNTVEIFVDEEVCWFGAYYDGAILWEDSSTTPVENSSLWEYPPFSALYNNGFMHSFVRQEDDYSREWWIAGTSGLYAYNGEDWFELGIEYKRRRWNDLTNSWEVSQQYFTNEEVLYGGEVSSPTCLLSDPFGRVWIGTDATGVTMYDPYTDRYKTYNTGNAPLLSDNITSLAYSPHTGRLYIGTTVGLNSVEIGRAEKWREDISKILVAPNPFHPDEGQNLTIANGVEGSFPIGEWTCYLYDIAGELVVELEEDIFFQFTWDGTNHMGKDCSSGVYFYVLSDGEGNTERGVISLIR